MYPYPEIPKARIAELLQQAERDALAIAIRRARRARGPTRALKRRHQDHPQPCRGDRQGRRGGQAGARRHLASATPPARRPGRPRPDPRP
jgi:hypothetical protein